MYVAQDGVSAQVANTQLYSTKVYKLPSTEKILDKYLKTKTKASF